MSIQSSRSCGDDPYGAHGKQCNEEATVALSTGFSACYFFLSDDEDVASQSLQVVSKFVVLIFFF